MLSINLDFIWSLNDAVNTLNLHAASRVGILSEKDSVSVIASPGGVNNTFYDNSKDQDYNIQFSAKSLNQELVVNSLAQIMYSNFTNSDVQSLNDSFVFNEIIFSSPPSFVVQDENGYYIWQLQGTAKLQIKGE